MKNTKEKKKHAVLHTSFSFVFFSFIAFGVSEASKTTLPILFL